MSWRRDVRAALPAWLVARLVVVAVYLIVRRVTETHVILHHGVRVTLNSGLVIGDASWYRDIARLGYRPLAPGGMRFFPLLPLLTRSIGSLGPSSGVSLLIVTNVCALAAAAVLHRLVLLDFHDEEVARVAVALLALQPLGFVLVLGYSEALFLVVSISMVLLLRTERPGRAGVFGVLAGLTRPTGALLALPAAIEVWRRWKAWDPRRRVAGAVAVVAAPLCTIAYLLWSRHVFGDALLPFRAQQAAGLRGRFTDPVSAVASAVRDVAAHGRLNVAMHIVWIVVMVALVVVCARRFPLSYTAFAASTVAIALTSTNLDSFERYALGAFPLTLAAAWVAVRFRLWRPLLVLSAVALAGYETLALLGRYVP
jgi:hypothetical protein